MTPRWANGGSSGPGSKEYTIARWSGRPHSKKRKEDDTRGKDELAPRIKQRGESNETPREANGQRINRSTSRKPTSTILSIALSAKSPVCPMSAGGTASSTATKPALFSTGLSTTTRISSSPQTAVKSSSSKQRAMTVTTATAVSNCSSVVNGQIWRAQSTATIWCLTKMIPDLTARIRLGSLWN